MKKTDIGMLRTPIRIETNAAKVVYGSGKKGAGYMDQYQLLKEVFGYFEPFNGRRQLANGDVVFVQMYKLYLRYDVEISNNLNNQLRFIIKGSSYSLTDYKFDEMNKEAFMVFTLNLFGK
jgi:hypothetical protein